MPDLRQAVLKELERRKWSRYKLVQLLKGKRADGTDVTQQSVYAFLRGQTSLNSDDLGLIADALEMQLKRKG